MSEHSSLKVKDIIDSFLCPVKVTYEGSVIYDDTGDFTIDGTEFYLSKPVYHFKVDVVQFHHTIIDINY